MILTHAASRDWSYFSAVLPPTRKSSRYYRRPAGRGQEWGSDRGFLSPVPPPRRYTIGAVTAGCNPNYRYRAATLEMGIYSIDWPPTSPDLNVSEKAWKRLKQRVRSCRPLYGWPNKDVLINFVLATRDELRPEHYRHHIDEMP